MKLANNHYLTGLAYLGMNKKTEALKEFENAIKLNPSHTWAKVHLNSLK